MCAECNWREKQRLKIKYKNNKAQYAIKNKEWKDRYRKEGKCYMCSAPLDEDMDGERSTCLNCRERVLNPQ